MIGEQIGDYQVVAKLGAGGMGVVYAAQHALLGGPAALKVLHPSLSSDHEIVQRFFNEAKAASAIRHPGIVEVYTFGYHTDGTAYIVMAYLEGISLEQHVVREGKLSENRALRIASQIAGALGAAHDKGIIHRDLKPDNVFLVPDADMPGGERIKLLDFGIAKLAGDRESTGYKTKTGAVFGTPAYMSPEQCRGADQVDRRSDLYALGCILYRLVCSRVPFGAELSGDVIAAQIRDAPPPPRSIDPSISEEVEAIILRLLAKSPSDRFDSASELRSAIAAVLGESTGQTRAIPEAVASPAGTADTLAASTTLAGAASQQLETPTRGSRAVLWAIATCVLIGAAGASIYLAASGDRVTATEADAGSISEVGTDAASIAELPDRVAASATECRDAFTRAAVLLAGDVPAAAVAYVYLREYAHGGDRAEAMVQNCTATFDRPAATCMAAAETALAVANCGDGLVVRDCDRGDTDACGSAAGLAYDRGDYQRAASLATASCEKGGAQGCTMLGLLHYYGRGVELDYRKAFRFYSSASALGDSRGSASAGEMLQFGIGVDKNAETARDLFEEACRIDDRDGGCVSLGEMLWSDKTRRKDALAMFERTCAAGNARGCAAQATYGKRDTKRLYAHARARLRAASQISPLAARRLAELVRDGLGGPAEPGEAVELLDSACSNNEPIACEQLGDLHVSGDVRLNLKKSGEAYQRACKAGLLRACERAECQRLSTEGRSADPAWTRRVRRCRDGGALGPVAAPRRQPIRKHPAKPPRKLPDSNQAL